MSILNFLTFKKGYTQIRLPTSEILHINFICAVHYFQIKLKNWKVPNTSAISWEKRNSPYVKSLLPFYSFFFYVLKGKKSKLVGETTIWPPEPRFISRFRYAEVRKEFRSKEPICGRPDSTNKITHKSKQCQWALNCLCGAVCLLLHNNPEIQGI